MSSYSVTLGVFAATQITLKSSVETSVKRLLIEMSLLQPVMPFKDGETLRAIFRKVIWKQYGVGHRKPPMQCY